MADLIFPSIADRNEPHPENRPVIEVSHLTYAYPLTSVAALYDVSVNVPDKQFCAIVGPNRGGKSTLCYALSGFIPHFYQGSISGIVKVAKRNVSQSSLGDLAGVVGLVFQNPFNQVTGARMTVLGEVAFGLENMGVPRDEILQRVHDALALTGLSALAERSPMQLSGGQQQRLAIASILVMRPQVLILDEPTSQLDPMGTKEVFSVLARLVEQRDTTVLLVEHKLEWVAEFASRVIALSNGQIVADGTPREVLTDPVMVAHGVGQTRYTVAARLSINRGLVGSDAQIPVTLDDGEKFFLQNLQNESND